MFGDTLSAAEKRSLATLIYYPREKMELCCPKCDDPQEWYETVLPRLVAVCKRAARKYTRSRVRTALPRDFAYIIEELMTENSHGRRQEGLLRGHHRRRHPHRPRGRRSSRRCACSSSAWPSTICTSSATSTTAGPYPDVIMDTLMGYHSLDIQWGNHDIVWMGAALGQRGCIAHVVRNCARYGNLSILEDAYGINILPLAAFATSAYADDPCVAFGLKGNPDLPPQELEMNVKIQKAMAIIQFKVEARAHRRDIPDSALQTASSWTRSTTSVARSWWTAWSTRSPTRCSPRSNPADPYRLTPEEEEVMQRLEQAFTGCEKLQRHMRFFLEAGSLYKVCNDNLLFHACVPLNADGSLKETDVFGRKYKGRALYDVMERYVRAAFYDPDPEMRKRGRDLLWYMWLGEGSPLFAKSKMATFELYLVAEKEARKEVKNPFYTYLDDERAMARRLRGLRDWTPRRRASCAATCPCKVKDGEDPVKCGGKRAHHRRRLLESLPAHHGHRRLHAHLELVRLRAGRPRAAGVGARRRGERARHPLVAPRGGAAGQAHARGRHRQRSRAQTADRGA